MTLSSALLHVAALGVWPALPLTGFWALRLSGGWRPLRDEPFASRVALASAIGIGIWSLPLLASTFPGWYSGAAFGVVGWLITLATAAWLVARRRDLELGALARNELDSREMLVVVALVALGGFYAAFPGESIQGGRDQGTYAMHGVYIAHHGTRDVAYPFDDAERPIFGDAYISPSGMYATSPAMTVQGGQVFPVWLAQAFATAGHIGLFRLNAAFAVIALGAFYGLCRAFLGWPVAAGAMAFVALNPSQVWLARTTLTELLTQLVVIAGALLMIRALEARHLPSARWAALLFGVAAFVRIDSFLFLALLFAAHAAWRVMNPAHERDESVWLALYQTAVPLFVAALAYYAFFAGSYLGGLAGDVRPIMAAAVAGLLLLLATRGRLLERVRPVVLSLPVRAAAATMLVAAAAFAYFVRPNLRPYALINWPGNPFDGTRSYIENAFLNLGVYVSPLVLWAAVAGVVLAVLLATTDRFPRLFVVPVVLIAGFAIPYSWDPRVTPDHFWAIRRFVPIVIPGLVLLAAFAAVWALSRLPRRVASAVAAMIVGLLALHAVTAIAPIAAISEFRGYYRTLNGIAARLPPGEIAIAHGSTTWASPLAVAFDRRIVRLDLDTGAGREAFERWAELQFARGRPVYLAYQRAPELIGLQVARRENVVVSAERIEPTFEPLPRTTAVARLGVTIYTISGVLPQVDYSGVNFVRALAWKQRDEGFYPRTTIDGGPARWTNGHARFSLPVNGIRTPRRLSLSVSTEAPGGVTLQVLVNSRELWSGHVGSAPSSLVVDLSRAPASPDRRLAIELVSDTFAVPSGGTTRPQGVAVRRLELVDAVSARLSPPDVSAARRT